VRMRGQHLEPWDYPQCSFDECVRHAQGAGGLCKAHDQQAWRGEKLRPLRKWSSQAERTCDGPGCDRPTKTHGLCGTHYMQKLKFGELWEVNVRSECTVPNCTTTFTRVSVWPMCKPHAHAARWYGLTPEAYIELMTDPVCQACRGGDSMFHIDHDHSCCPDDKRKKCGKCVRGVLCRRCNWVLGHVKDDQSVLSGLVDYLERFRVRLAA